MQLEKRNETVWSIKRKNYPGRFGLRATEEAGEIIKVSITLEEQNNAVTFEMKYPEFENFYGIITSFKHLIESPGNLAQKSEQPTINQNQVANTLPLMNLDGTPLSGDNSSLNSNPHIIKESNKPHLHDIDEGLASLEILDKEDDFIESKPEPAKVQLKIPTIPKSSDPNEDENKPRLKETDWDPW